MATLFALLHSCGRVVIKMQNGLRSMRVCKSVCRGISIPLPWAICGQTDPIMFVLQDQIGCVPPSLGTRWCPFQPSPRASQLPLSISGPGKVFILFHLFILESKFSFQPLTTALDWYKQLFWKEEPKRQKNNCIQMHQHVHISACLGFKCCKCAYYVTFKPKGWDFRLNDSFSATSDSIGRFCDHIIWESCHEISLCLIVVWKWRTFLNFLFLTWKNMLISSITGHQICVWGWMPAGNNT